MDSIEIHDENKTILLYKIINDLPAPPQEIIDSIDVTYKPTINDYGLDNQRHLKNWNGKNAIAPVNRRVKHELFETWVKNNITTEFNDCGVNYVLNVNSGPTSTGGHTDGTRNFVLLYPILQGGEHAMLTFWKEEGHSIIRPRVTWGEDFTKLRMLGQVKLPEGKWLLNHTNVIHSVENLFSTRINLQISLNEHPWK
tara:strand:- start:217 stop:807 length:591 start_codon:yes stop_codon:yes gene_type:complete